MMLCPECGKENKDDANLCTQCSATLGKQESPAPKKSTRGKSWKPYAIGFVIVIVVAILVIIGVRVSTSKAPSVATNDATEITANGATLNGTLTRFGYNKDGTVDGSFQWGTSSGSYVSETDVIEGYDIGTFYFLLGGLTSNTTYYYRAKVVGDNGARYGTEKSFTTP